MGRIVCFGELLLRLGAPGRELLLQSPQLQVHVGGAEANVAVSLSRFGHDVAMVSTVAGNALGAHALAELRRHGVDTRGVREDAEGRMGATASIVVHAVLPYYERTGHWEAIAWWVHDHLPYADMEFFPKLCAFNLQWREGTPTRRISSFIPPRRGLLTAPGMPNHSGRHEAEYAALLAEIVRLSSSDLLQSAAA